MRERNNFAPLTYLRDVDELRCGARALADHPQRKIKYLWELITNLKADLQQDLGAMGPGVKGEVHPSAVIIERNNVLIDEGAEIEPYAVLDARQGPIYLGRGTIVRAGASLRGPLSIGPNCRVGGEIVHSIFHANSNKGHYGFIGHSYIGEWVNLGAGTTNSNLKNTYGTVKIGGVDTGEQFLGCIIGDYVRTGIGTLINTGTMIGFGANVLGGKLTPKHIPDFSWDGAERWRLAEFLLSIERMMARRGVDLSDQVQARITELYRNSGR